MPNTSSNLTIEDLLGLVGWAYQKGKRLYLTLIDLVSKRGCVYGLWLKNEL